MTIKLTPLNILSAVCLVFMAWTLIKEDPEGGDGLNRNAFFIAFCGALAVLAFVADLIFRRLVPSLRKLWLIEGMVVMFMVIITYILKVSIK